MAKVGDKFIVEVTDVIGKANDENTSYYILDGLSGRFFDDADLGRLQKYGTRKEPGKSCWFNVGDEVEFRAGCHDRFYVTRTEAAPGSGSYLIVSGIDADGGIHSAEYYYLRKTGARNLTLARMFNGGMCEFANDPEEKK